MVSNIWKATFSGVVSALNAYLSLDDILTTASEKAVVLQAQLSRAPEITAKTYEAAHTVTTVLTSGNYHGFISAAIAGFTGVLAIYYASRKDEGYAGVKNE